MCYLNTQIYWNSLTVTTMVSFVFSPNSYVSISRLCFVLIWSAQSKKKKKSFFILFALAEPFQREEGQKKSCPLELCIASWAKAIKEISPKLEEFFKKNHAGNLIRAKDPWGLEGHIFLILISHLFKLFSKIRQQLL